MNATVAPDALGPTPVPSARGARQAELVAALAPLLPAQALLWQGEDTVP